MKVAVLLLAVWPLAPTLAIHIAEFVLAERVRGPTAGPPVLHAGHNCTAKTYSESCSKI
jgi:hypothetical protein